MPTLVANLETRYELSAIFIPVCLQRLAENLLISRHALLSVCLYQSHNTHEGVLYRDYRDLSWFAANTCCIAILFVIPKKEKKTTASLVLILQHHTTLVWRRRNTVDARQEKKFSLRHFHGRESASAAKLKDAVLSFCFLYGV